MEENILNAEVYWLGSRCYRINSSNANRQNEKAKVNYEEEDFDCELDCEDDFLQIEAIDNGSKFQFKTHVPQNFHGTLIGTKGTTKKRIEQGEKGSLILTFN